MKLFHWLTSNIGIIIMLVSGFIGCTPEEQPLASKPKNDADFTITNLYDVFGKERDGLTKDFGFSALISYRDKNILFDAGTNADILKSNAEAMGIDLSTVDYAIGSHAHGDHINGFDYLLQVNPEIKLYLPYDFYTGANINFDISGTDSTAIDSLPDEMKYFGGKSDLNININQSGRFWGANVTHVRNHLDLGDGAKLIFTRSPYLGYGSKYPSIEELDKVADVRVNSGGEMKFAGLPELSLSLTADKGEVLLVGCSHSSVQNIVNDALEFTGNQVLLVYGGYHMLPYGKQEIMAVANHLKHQLGVSQVAPTHCTGHLAFKLLQEEFGEEYLFAGLGETLSISAPTGTK
jgi:7,8-dihydropterin-6-yl-methyl-4-(beta-D-ribofuranosyl)aminobenzene 5'-phosphate synthase